MRYPINIEPCNEGGFFVSFPDIPEALTQGDSYEDALFMGLDALLTAFEFYFEDNKKIPLPSEITGDSVKVPASIVAKIQLLNAMVDANITQVELASRINSRKQEVQRILDIRHNTKIDTIELALCALGKSLVITTI